MLVAKPRRARRAALLAAFVLLAATPALAVDEPAGASRGITDEQVLAIAFDVFVMRPMDFMQVMIGAAVLPVAFLIALPSWALDLAGAPEPQALVDFIVKEPAQHLFKRPLGELS